MLGFSFRQQGFFYETAIFCCGPMGHKKAAPAEMRGAASPQGEQ